MQFLVALLLLTMSNQGESDSLSAAKDYNNIPGAQIYLFSTGSAFSYITIDSTITSKLKATVYLYLSSPLSSLSNGVYTAIGFGTSQMSNADILLCAVTNSQTQWCKDYMGFNGGISQKSSITTVVSSVVNTIGAGWSPYITQIIWQIERAMDPTPYINGSKSAITAFGNLNSSGTPQQHPDGYNKNINTGDGNTSSPPQAAATISSSIAGTDTAASGTASAITNSSDNTIASNISADTAVSATSTGTTVNTSITTGATKPKNATYIKSTILLLFVLIVAF